MRCLPLLVLALGCSSASKSTDIPSSANDAGDAAGEAADAGTTDAPDDSWDTFPASPLATVTSAGKKLKIAAFTAPKQPPARGMISAKLVVTNATTTEPVDGLTIDVEPFMPSMGHGTPDVPTTTPKGSGRYLVEDVSLFMVGTWELRLTITGAVNDTAVITVQIR